MWIEVMYESKRDRETRVAAQEIVSFLFDFIIK